MPQTCTICRHPERAAVDQALLTPKESLRNIAKRFETSDTALFRHKRDHLSAALVKAQEAKEAAQGESLFDQFQRLHGRTLKVLDQAEVAGDLKTTLAAIREVRSNFQFLAEIFARVGQTVTSRVVVEFPGGRTEALEFLPRPR